MNDSNAKFEYDIQKRARAGTRATLRAVVAGYLVYLAWQIVKGVRTGSSAMAPAVAWAAAIVFTLAAVGVGIYAFKSWRADVEAARLPKEEGPEAGGALPEDTGASPDE